MTRYRCDDCDYECKLEMEIPEDAPAPDSCVIDNHSVEWIRSIIIKTTAQ